jgi:hypothetical protein
MRQWVVSCALAVVMVVSAGCRSDHPSGAADLTLFGRAEVVSASGTKTPVFRSQTVKSGETIRLVTGTGVLKLGDDRTIEMRKGSAIKVGEEPTLMAGDALLVAERSRLTVRAAGSILTLRQGAARVSRGLAVDTATYAGSVTLTSAGRRFAIPALREATVASLGVLPAKAEPLKLKRTDAWDRRFLGDAIELTEQLQSRSDGLTGQLPSGEGRSAGFVASLLPELHDQSGFADTLVDPNRTPGETVVGASIALAARSGSLDQRWQSVFSFRDEGAAWGLVALDQRVADIPELSSKLDAALGRAQSYTLQAAAPPPPPPPTASEPATTTPPVTTAKPSSSTPPGATSGNGDSGTTNTPPTTAPDVLGDVVDTVGGVVSGLVSTLLGQ